MNKLILTFVNVGYGESMLLRCPDSGFAMLIDAGSAETGEYADGASGRMRTEAYLEAVGLDHIDIMVSTHIHEDHICGMLPVARRWRPARLWQTLPADFARTAMRPVDEALATNASQSKFIRALNDARALFMDLEADGRLQAVCAGHHAEPCPGLSIDVLAPGEARCAALADGLRAAMALEGEAQLKALSALDAAMNNYSLILMLDFRGTRILLPGDTNRAGYGDIPAGALRAEIFKVGHHGQQDGADAALVGAVRAGRVVCCASSDRRYNSAHPALMDLLRDSGARLLFSDCPPVPGESIPPHNALEIEITPDGVEDRYILL